MTIVVCHHTAAAIPQSSVNAALASNHLAIILADHRVDRSLVFWSLSSAVRRGVTSCSEQIRPADHFTQNPSERSRGCSGVEHLSPSDIPERTPRLDSKCQMTGTCVVAPYLMGARSCIFRLLVCSCIHRTQFKLISQLLLRILTGRVRCIPWSARTLLDRSWCRQKR